MKRVFCIIPIFLSAFLFQACKNNVATQASPNDNQQSNFVGTWYCSKEESCNGMEITLTITQDGKILNFDRKMISGNGIGGSDLTGRASIPTSNEISADYISGSYTLNDEILYEHLAKTGQQNKFIKKDENDKTKINGDSVTNQTGLGESSTISNDSDYKKAKAVANEYCSKLINKQPSIISIDYTGDYTSIGECFYFDYEVHYNAMTKKGTLTVEKGNDGNFTAISLMFR